MPYVTERAQTSKLSKKLVKLLLSIALPATLLTGCNQASSSGCPPLVTYPAGFQQKAAQELPKAGENVQVLVTDYGKLRDACRTMK